ncbi:MAG TPA: hypothetical protein VGB45_10130 [Abditibacterium sp.]|jgi:hypothetical protein
MKFAVFAAALLLCFPVDAQDNYLSYRNARFGTTVLYPANLLVPRPESANGDGRRFFSRDGKVELSVFAFHNTSGRSIRREMNRALRDWRRDGARVTYQKFGSTWFVASGYVGSDIFYEKTLFKAGVFHTLIWQYPQSLKARLDAPVTRSVRSFSVGKSLERPIAAPSQALAAPAQTSVAKTSVAQASPTPRNSQPRVRTSGY